MNLEADMSLSQVAVMSKGSKGNQYQQPTEFQCPVCKKYFSRKCTLQMHLLIHQDVKPHICPFCGQSFRQKGTLMRHKALHSKTALFHCELCKKNYRQKNVFLHHLRHRHNVATDSLDRRRDTTRLADNQSLLRQLPSFAKADDRVINMSDKTFENLLLNSLGTESVNTMRQKYKISSSFPSSTTDESLIVELTGVQSNKMEWINHSENQSPLHPHYSNDNKVSYGKCKREICEIPKMDVTIRWQCQYCSFNIRFDHQACWDHLSLHRNDQPYDCYRCLQLFRNEKDCKSHMLKNHSLLMNQIDSKLRASKELVYEESANSELLISDVESDVSVPSGVVAELEKAEGQHSEVSDSLYLQDMTYTCIPCQLDFSCEDEFEVHVKSHVQSILVTDEDPEKHFAIPGLYEKSDQLSHDSAPSSEICSVKSCDSVITSQASCSLHSPNYDRHEEEREDSGCYKQKKSFLCDEEGRRKNLNNCLGMSEKVNDADPKKRVHSERDISKRNTINGETCERNNNSMRNRCRTIVRTAVMAFFCPYCDLYFDKKTGLQKHVDKHVRLLAVQLINDVGVNREKKISFRKKAKMSCLFVKEESCKRNCSKSLEMSVLQNKDKFSTDSNCSNQKQFVCQKCGEKFQKRNSYLYHKQLHFGKRSFSSFCKSQKLVYKHLKYIRNRHIKQYQCSKCMKTFFCYKVMKLHHNQCLSKCLGSCLEKYVENISLPITDLTKKNDMPSGVIGIIPVGALQCSSHTFSENFNTNNKLIGIPVLSLQSLPELGSLPFIGKISLNPTAK